MDQVPGRLATIVPENSIRFLGHDTHTHSEPHLVYVGAGSARLAIDGEQVILGVHESVWLAPNVPHSARYSPGSLVLGPILSPSTLPPEPVHRLGSIPAVTAVMTAILGAAPTTDTEVQVFRAALDDVLTRLRGPWFSLPAPTHPVAAAVARELPFSSESLDQIAARHGISGRHLQRIFVSETGIAFRQWRVRARLNVAIGRLREGASVTHAARTAGYETGSGLRKALLREAGIDADALRR
ncbi:AraC family transcriptional regulator [Gordonia liuliyuniae]|uniref:Helix-turn-helix transcriptional regulator n=1 Tax=Gordonia liuliyuniae TaxID=2911517 RepID=A0ABS9IVA3_9ACTN|nr:helix-turn-helix transcriptional regulator [Gordonia liuliyuniae]MCF8589407.1 helix-turn-helix transcriptional regulator [Gordonia liuliyuniae]